MGKRIFISYKRNTELDHPLAERLHQEFQTRGHQVFIDQGMRIGDNWNERIPQEIHTADYFLVLISKESMQSGMVRQEVEIACRKSSTESSPKILPIRVAYTGDLDYTIGARLGDRNHFCQWHNEGHDKLLINALLEVIEDEDTHLRRIVNQRTPSLLPVKQLEPASFSVYVRRVEDKIVEDELDQPRYTLVIQGAPQTGKTSLLNRIAQNAKNSGRQVTILSCQEFLPALNDTNQLFYQFSYLIQDALGLENKLDESWQTPLAPAQKCQRFMERHVLPHCQETGLLLALDEADSLLPSPNRTDFFGMLRSWCGWCANRLLWHKFSLVIASINHPAAFISSTAQSPFNTGSTIVLRDFSLEETQEASRLFKTTLSLAELSRLYKLLAGHPYLTLTALKLLSRGHYSLENLLTTAHLETGPFAAHLQTISVYLYSDPELADMLRSALNGKRPTGLKRTIFLAQGWVDEETNTPRNELYAKYFRHIL